MKEHIPTSYKNDVNKKLYKEHVGWEKCWPNHLWKKISHGSQQSLEQVVRVTKGRIKERSCPVHPMRVKASADSVRQQQVGREH